MLRKALYAAVVLLLLGGAIGWAKWALVRAADEETLALVARRRPA